MKYDFEIDLNHDNSLSLIYDRVKPSTRVLEFGPANGRLTKVMKENLNCEVYLAEIDVEAGKQAAVFAEDIVFGDIEQYEWAERYQNLKFDYILFADVLEHLRNPYDVLLRCKKYLEKQGRILLSVPNVAHNSIIIDLMKNRFQYSDIGLLDNTHIHLFTKNSLEEMIEQAGYFAVRKMATYSQVGTNEFSNCVTDIPEISASYWNGRQYGEVYQFVYEIALKAPDVCEDLIKAVNTRNYAQLYYGMDRYNEGESEKFYLGYTDAVQHLNFKFGQPVRELRFDPYNGTALVALHSVVGITDTGDTVEAKMSSSNAEYKYGTEYIFVTDDPNVNLIFEKPVVGVCVDMSVVSANSDEIRKICNCYKTILQAQDRELLNLQKTGQNLAKERNQLVNEKVQQREQLLSDKSKLEESLRQEIEKVKSDKSKLEESLRQEIDELQKKQDDYERKIQELNGMLAAQQDVINQKDYVLNQTFNSKSWKMTRIFRRK
jgi:2-polyprenyl-3-methyl-5-hydroxy-6-metoxy-1,4-benzoquinol methylase